MLTHIYMVISNDKDLEVKDFKVKQQNKLLDKKE